MSSRALLEEIAAFVPERGVVVWWLGQAGFIVRGRSASIAIDPFVTDYGQFGRLYEPPCQPSEIDFLDLLLGTHNHADHIDPIGFAQVLEASGEAVGVVPAAVLPEVAEMVGSSTRLVGATVDQVVERSGVAITAIPAVHGATPEDGYGFHLNERGEHPFVGYVLELDGVRICHVGDTLIYDGLADRLRRADLDLLILPINGVSWFRERRGLAGNMNVFEAAELAEASNAPLTLPVHWDLFADNTEDPEHFVRYAAAKHPAANVTVPSIGVPLHLPPREPTSSTG